MTEFTSSNDPRIHSMFSQIRNAILQLQSWNADTNSPDDYYTSPEGMKNLAASCMLIEAIGEGIKRIDNISQSKLLVKRPEIPWIDVMGMRNHIPMVTLILTETSFLMLSRTI